MKRWPAVVRGGGFCVSAPAAAGAGGVQLQQSRFTIWQGFSLRWYEAALHDPQLAEAAWNSLLIALAATLVSTCIGTLCAYALWKRKSRLISGSLYTTLVTPEIVMGVSLLAFFQWVFRFLHVQLGMHTVILAHVTVLDRLCRDCGHGPAAHR